MCVFQPHLLVRLYKRDRLWHASWGWSHASKIDYCVGLREGRGFEWLSDYSYIILEGASRLFSWVLILLTPPESAAHLVQAAGCCKGSKHLFDQSTDRQEMTHHALCASPRLATDGSWVVLVTNACQLDGLGHGLQSFILLCMDSLCVRNIFLVEYVRSNW